MSTTLWRALTCLVLVAWSVMRGGAGPGPLFERTVVPGISEIREGMNGVALADLNRDGRVDIMATYAEPDLLGKTGQGTELRVFLNSGGFRFREHRLVIRSQQVSARNFGLRAQIPVLADFNDDSFLDVLVSRSARTNNGKVAGRSALGNTLLVSQGRWDVFVDVSRSLGIRNETAHNRQASFGDANKDGWLDIAIGADNIGNSSGGFPYSRLYIFQPKGPRFENGTFKDLGGTALIPDFGGFYHDSERDKAGPDINLIDLDNDGDLDLVQSYHVDCREPGLPYSPCEYRQGVFAWRNMVGETGTLRFEPLANNGLSEVGKLRYDRVRKVYDPVLIGPGLAYVSLADANNDALVDVLAVGPSDPAWAPRAESVGGRFWYNLGGLRFARATEKAGFSALNWAYRDWYTFFGIPLPRRTDAARLGTVAQPGLPRPDLMDNRPYYADSVFADFDNDGWLDVVILDRKGHPGIEVRAMLFMNKGDGSFEPKPTTFSGLDAAGINGEVSDLDNDGLLDLVFAADPDNSGTARSLEQYETRFYRNTGSQGARQNHWVRVRFSGIPDARLIGARVEARKAGVPTLLGTRVVASKQSYKSGSPLEAHFGLGNNTHVDLKVVLLDGKTIAFPAVRADRFFELNLMNGSATTAQPQ
jgi:hypothetical protein